MVVRRRAAQNFWNERNENLVVFEKSQLIDAIRNNDKITDNTFN